MSKKASVGNDALKLTISKMMVLVIQMISAMLLSRFRTVEEYGTYSQLLMAVNLATTVIMMGLPNSLNYFLAGAEGDKEKGHFLNVYYTMSTILSAVVGCVLVVLVPFLVSYFENPLLNNFLFFLAVFPWTKIIMSSVENVLVVYKRTNLIMAYRVLNSIFLLSIILIVQVFEWTFTTYMVLYLVVEAVFSVLVYVFAKQSAGRLCVAIDIELTKRIFKFSIPMGIATMLGTLNIELAKVVIGGLMDTESLAIFTNASKEMPVTIIASSITAVLLPRMVKLLKNKQNEDAVKLWSKATNISFAIITFLAFALFVFAPEVMTILYSEKYLSGVSVFRVYSLVLPLRCTYFGMVLNASGHTKKILYSSVISLVLNLCMNIVFYKMFGFVGPAIASLVAQLVINVVQLLWTSRVIEVKFSRIFDWKLLGISLIKNAVLAVVFYVIKSVVPLEAFVGEIIESILLGFIWMIVFAIIEFKNLKKQWVFLNKAD